MRLSVRFSFSLLANISLVLLLLPAQATAEKRVALYDASQLVLDESPSLRQQAAATALAQVFVKVAGNEQVLNNPLIEDALLKATAYLSQYRYQSTDETLPIAGDAKPARRLLMQFSEVSVQRIFKLAQLPIWPDQRPEVLLWLAGENGNKVMLGTSSSAMSAFKVAADERGLPISAPLLDLTDRQALSAARLWAIDENAIRAASIRYDLDVVLAGRISRVGANTSESAWQGNFIVLRPSQLNSERLYFRASGSSEQDVAQQIITQITDYLSGLSAIVVSDQLSAPTFNIQVSNIADFTAYTGLLRYLKSLPVIASVMVSRVEGNTVELALGYNGNSDKLLAALSTSEVLEKVASAPSPSVVNTPVVPVITGDNTTVERNISAKYRWR